MIRTAKIMTVMSRKLTLTNDTMFVAAIRNTIYASTRVIMIVTNTVAFIDVRVLRVVMFRTSSRAVMDASNSVMCAVLCCLRLLFV